MATHAAVLKRIVQSVADADVSCVSDRELLRRFVQHDEQAAFAALVQRHTALVYGVCRRALSHPQDAEDACQATFLILARKADSQRWQPSVANWLYATARKVARNALAASQRRRARERRAAVPESVPATDAMTGRELLAILDEELEKLPPRYREPLVLCCLESLTRDEAATRLGVPAGTLKIRLERARKRLSDALAARGCGLGVGLLAVAVTSPAGASPPRLMDAVLASVAGEPSPAVAALARGVAVNGMQKWTMAALLLIGAAVLGIAFGRGTPTAAGPLPDPPAKPAPADELLMTVTGRVVDPDGTPRAGVGLTLVGRECAPAAAGTTDGKGAFTVRVPRGWKGVTLGLMARADGFAVDFVNLLAIDPKKPIELKLGPDCPVRGRLIDTEGKPLVGVRVVTTYLPVFASLDDYLAAWRKRHEALALPPSTRSLIFRPEHSPPFATATDKDGRFTLTGLGVDRPVTLTMAGGGAAKTYLTVVTRPKFDPKPFNEATLKKTPYADGRIGDDELLMDGPEFTRVVETEKVVRGTVVEDDTGKPRPGVTVLLTGADYRGPNLTATTDAAGRYEIRGCKKMAAYMVRVASDRTAGLLPREVVVSDTAGYEPIVAEVRAGRGIVVKVRLIDGGTGKPVHGEASVHVLADNPHVARGAKYEGAKEYADYFAGPDGVIRLVSVPGRVVVVGKVAADDFKYKLALSDPKYPQYFPNDPRMHGSFLNTGGGHTIMQGNHCKVLDLAADAREVLHDITLEPAPTTTVAVRDADGNPLKGAWATGVTSKVWASAHHCAGDTCPVYGVEPGKRRLVVLYEPTKKLAATLVLTGDEKAPLVAKLAPTASLKGRLVDEAGKPLAGAFVRVWFEQREADAILSHFDSRAGVESDATGAFRLDNVIPGMRFTIEFRRGRQQLEPVMKDRIPATVKLGETLDLGDVMVKPSKNGE